jgi:hypothetical protein
VIETLWSYDDLFDEVELVRLNLPLMGSMFLVRYVKQKLTGWEQKQVWTWAKSCWIADQPQFKQIPDDVMLSGLIEFFQKHGNFLDMLYERDPNLHEILQPSDATPPINDVFEHNRRMIEAAIARGETPQPRPTPTPTPKLTKTRNVYWTTSKKPGT